jgi:hypothetical protein
MTAFGDALMSPGSITALAAIFGSLVGALGSSISTWITQRHQDRRDLLARKVFHREQLYSDFITESARVLVDALESVISYSVSRSHPHEVSSPRISGLSLF